MRGHTWSEFEKLEAEKNVKQIEVNEDEDLGDEEQSEELLEHDPREWKTANLYAVLGLSHLRSKATEDQIRRAHRKQVLKHHPDKKSASGGLENDGFFKIIQKPLKLCWTQSREDNTILLMLKMIQNHQLQNPNTISLKLGVQYLKVKQDFLLNNQFHY